jgi:hypothetical protein
MRDRRRGFVLGLLLLTVASGAVPAAGERAELGAAFERLAAIGRGADAAPWADAQRCARSPA